MNAFLGHIGDQKVLDAPDVDASKKGQPQQQQGIHKQIDIRINLDHGKGHSIISDNFILRYQDDSHGGAWCKDSYSCSLGNY